MDQRRYGFYQSVTDDLREWVFHYAENKTVWPDKDGTPWSIDERITKGGGTPTPPPDMPHGFEYLIDLFFRLRGFCGEFEKPITPALIDGLREYVSDVDCDIIYEMDKGFGSGAAKARDYWKDN